MKHLIIGLVAITAVANDDIQIYLEPPIAIPHELQPIKPVPPVGTERCEQQYLCNTEEGECRWVTICK